MESLKKSLTMSIKLVKIYLLNCTSIGFIKINSVWFRTRLMLKQMILRQVATQSRFVCAQ